MELTLYEMVIVAILQQQLVGGVHGGIDTSRTPTEPANQVMPTNP
ncbi:UNVERIFIED_CONTAM: hypothetical protein FKN15_057917 [Acipenser sinensis]